MSDVETKAQELDYVELLEAIDQWPVGTEGVVQVVKGGWRVVEVLAYDESRDLLDHLLDVRPDQLRVVGHHGSSA